MALQLPLFCFSLPVHLARSKISHPAGQDSCQLPDFPNRQNPYSIVMKILLADPHPEVQSALCLIVNRIPEVTEVSEADSLVQLLARCTQSCPDLILFDLDIVHPAHARSQTLSDLINVLHHLCPYSKIVAMSSRLEADQEVIAAGANGFISKTDPPDEVFSGIVRLLGINS